MTTALTAADDGHGDEPANAHTLVHQFHRMVGRVLSVNKVSAPQRFLDALESGTLLMRGTMPRPTTASPRALRTASSDVGEARRAAAGMHGFDWLKQFRTTRPRRRSPICPDGRQSSTRNCGPRPSRSSSNCFDWSCSDPA
jgi:hypothetical protein